MNECSLSSYTLLCCIENSNILNNHKNTNIKKDVFDILIELEKIDNYCNDEVLTKKINNVKNEIIDIGVLGAIHKNKPFFEHDLYEKINIFHKSSLHLLKLYNNFTFLK